jgi:hypothetical protein
MAAGHLQIGEKDCVIEIHLMASSGWYVKHRNCAAAE